MSTQVKTNLSWQQYNDFRKKLEAENITTYEAAKRAILAWTYDLEADEVIQQKVKSARSQKKILKMQLD